MPLLVPGLHAGQPGDQAVVEIPDAEAHRLDTQRDIIRQSLIRLADLAGATA